MQRWRIAVVIVLGALAACGQPARPTVILSPGAPSQASTPTPLVFMTDTPAPSPTLIALTPTRTPAAQPAGTELPEAQPIGVDNAAGLTRLGEWTSVAGMPEALEFTSSGRSLWASAVGRVWVWRARDGVLVRTAASVALSPDGQFAVETFGVTLPKPGQAEHLIYVLKDTGSGAEVTRWMDIKPVDVSSCRPGECANLRFAPNAGALGEIEDLAPGQRLPVLKVWRREGTLVFAAPGTQAFTFSADGMLVVARQATEPPVNIWRVADGALLKSISPGLIPGPLALSPDNARLAVAGAGRVQVWRWGEGALEREWTAEANSLAFNADGTLLAIGGVGSVRLLSIADGRELLSFSVLGGNGQLALSPDGRRLAVVAGERVEIWGVPGN